MLIPRGYKTRAAYMAHVKEWERAMYRDNGYEENNYFSLDVLKTRLWSNMEPWKFRGLRRVVYQGIDAHEYHRPMFELRPVFCEAETVTGGWCIACYADDWCGDDDVVRFVTSYTVFREDGTKEFKPITFDEDFAAKAGHP